MGDYDELIDGIHGVTGHGGDPDHLHPCQQAAAYNSLRRLVRDVATAIFGKETLDSIKTNLARYGRTMFICKFSDT